jgi:hypothetical protein
MVAVMTAGQYVPPSVPTVIAFPSSIEGFHDDGGLCGPGVATETTGAGSRIITISAVIA